MSTTPRQNPTFDTTMHDIIKFVRDKCEETDSPLNVSQMCREYNSRTGDSRPFHFWVDKVRKYRAKLSKIDKIDDNFSLKEMFALSVYLNVELIKELRQDAIVEVDDENRIIKYESMDGSIRLEGTHSTSGRRKWARQQKIMKAMALNFDEEGEDDVEILEIEDEEEEEVEEKRRKIDPDPPSQNIPQILEKKQLQDYLNKNFPLLYKSVHEESVPRGNQDIPKDLEDLLVPKQEEKQGESMIQTPKASTVFRFAVPKKEIIEEEEEEELQLGGPPMRTAKLPEEKKSEVNKQVVVNHDLKVEEIEKGNSTSQLKILEALRSLILSLNSKSLENLGLKIEKKIKKAKNDKIANNTIVIALESSLLLLARDANPSVTGESISINLLLHLFRLTVLFLNMPDLDDFKEKLTKSIEEFSIVDKKVPIGKVKSAFDTALFILVP